MPKVIIIPHYQYEGEFSNFLDGANTAQSDLKFYLLPPSKTINSPLKEPISDFKALLKFLDSKKKEMDLDTNDLLIAFYDGVITAVDYGLMNLFIAGASPEDEFPCTAVVSLQFISWGILEQKYDYALQRHALFHLVMCCLIGGYTQVEAHNETHGCLLDFNNHLLDFNRKLQMGYYLCSDNQRGCYDAIESYTYGNSIIQLCQTLKEGIDQNKLQIIIKELLMGDKIENKIGSISNVSGQVFIGKFNDVVANLNNSGQSDLADALNSLKDSVLASQSLAEEKKKEQIEVINQLGEEAAKSTPNKTLMKMLGNGLLTTLKAIPDIAKTIGSVAPIIEKLYS